MGAPTILNTDPVTPLESIFNSLGANLNGERQIKTFKVADLLALSTTTSGVTEGDLADVAAAECFFRATGSGWEQITEARFTTAAARDTEFAKASGIYNVAGRARALITGTNEHTEYNGAIWRSTNSGLIPIIPTSAVNGTIGSGGTVTFSAQSVININGCFPTYFDLVVAKINISTSTGGPQIGLKLRVGGVDDGSANYDMEQSYSTGSGTTTVPSAGGISWQAQIGAMLAGSGGTITAEIQSAALAAQTSAIFEANTRDGTTTRIGSKIWAGHRLATAYDGLSILPSVGTITGTVRFYGYNNN